MWHEARKQERRIRGMIVDYRKRAERRQDFYEKIQADPTQFIQIHGRRCKIHLDPAVAAAGAGAAIIVPWQGQQDNLIDRFDVRAHLDYIPTVPKSNTITTPTTAEGIGSEMALEERQCNYERYRILAQNDFLNVPEEKFLHQLYLEEQYGANAQLEAERNQSKKKQQKNPGATIGYSYDDGGDTGGGMGPQPFSHLMHISAAQGVGSATAGNKTDAAGKSTVTADDKSGSASDDSDSDMDMDVAIDISKLETAQAHELNTCGRNYGMVSNDFYSYLTKDADEADALRIAREEEQEKMLLSGRKSRRERRAQKERRIACRPFSPPSYAAKEDTAGVTSGGARGGKQKDEESDASRSPSPVAADKITYITSFGGEDELQPHSKISINLVGATASAGTVAPNTLGESCAGAAAAAVAAGGVVAPVTYAQKVKENLDKLKQLNETSASAQSKRVRRRSHHSGTRSRSRGRDDYNRRRVRRRTSYSRTRSRSYDGRRRRSCSSSYESRVRHQRRQRNRRTRSRTRTTSRETATRRNRRYNRRSSSSSSSSVSSRSSRSSRSRRSSSRHLRRQRGGECSGRRHKTPPRRQRSHSSSKKFSPLPYYEAPTILTATTPVSIAPATVASKPLTATSVSVGPPMISYPFPSARVHSLPTASAVVSTEASALPTTVGVVVPLPPVPQLTEPPPPPLKRYYGRKRGDDSSTSNSDSDDSTNAVPDSVTVTDNLITYKQQQTLATDVNDDSDDRMDVDTTSERSNPLPSSSSITGKQTGKYSTAQTKNPSFSNASETKGSGAGVSSGRSSSSSRPNLRDRLKRKMQNLLNKQYKADKRAEIEKSTRERQMQQAREDEMRELALKLRRRQRELRHRYGTPSSSKGSDSDASDGAVVTAPKSAHKSKRSERSRSSEILPKVVKVVPALAATTDKQHRKVATRGSQEHRDSRRPLSPASRCSVSRERKRTRSRSRSRSHYRRVQLQRSTSRKRSASRRRGGGRRSQSRTRRRYGRSRSGSRYSDRYRNTRTERDTPAADRERDRDRLKERDRGDRDRERDRKRDREQDKDRNRQEDRRQDRREGASSRFTAADVSASSTVTSSRSRIVISAPPKLKKLVDY